jgi:hypothetical protein
MSQISEADRFTDRLEVLKLLLRMRRSGEEKDNTVVIVRTGRSVAFMHDLTSPLASGICYKLLQAVITLATHVEANLPRRVLFIFTVGLEGAKMGRNKKKIAWYMLQLTSILLCRSI